MSNFLKNIHPLLKRKKGKDYDDANFAVLNALNYELTQTEKETIESKVQSSLELATGEYLDTWGDWFGVYRKDGWGDDYYRARIIRELLLKRSTIPAIIDAILDFLGDNGAHVSIYEPWKNIFYTNKSKLNGPDHLMGYYYRFAIIDISIDRPFPPEIVEVIKAFKPAGVLFYIRLDDSIDPNKVVTQYPTATPDQSKLALTQWNGIRYEARGNVNLGNKIDYVVDSNVFYTNKSKLNGEDVLAGSFHHGRSNMHAASTFTDTDYNPTDTTKLSDFIADLEEGSADMYILTDSKDGNGPLLNVAKKTGGMTNNAKQYVALDINNYVDTNLSNELASLTKDLGVKEGLNKLLSNPSLSVTIRAVLPPKEETNCTISIYDFVNKKWQELKSEKLGANFVTLNLPFNRTIDYLNDNKALFIRILHNRRTDKDYTVELDMLDLSFHYVLGSGNTIRNTMEVASETKPMLKKYVLTLDGGSSKTGDFLVNYISQKDYLGITPEKDTLYAVQPEMVNSGRVYFLGNTYVNKVQEEDRVIYARNRLIGGYYKTNSATSDSVANYTRYSLSKVFKAGEKITVNLKYKVTQGNYNTFEIRFREVETGDNITNIVVPVTDGVITAGATLSKDCDRVYIYTSVYDHAIDRGCVIQEVYISEVTAPYTVAPEDLFPSSSNLLPQDFTDNVEDTDE